MLDKDIVISIKTILIFLLMLLGAYVVYRLGPILSILLISTLIVLAMEKAINFFMKKTLFNRPVSRSLAVILSYSIIIILTITILTFGLQPILTQGTKLIINLVNIIQNVEFETGTPLAGLFGESLSLSSFLPQVTNISGGVLNATLLIFSNITTLITIFIFSIYMSLDWENLKSKFLSLWPKSKKEEIEDTIQDIEDNLGQWIKGQLFLMVIIGTLSFAGLILLDVDYPLALGVVSGVLEIVPILGPLISAVIAAIIAFSDDPLKGVGVLVLFTIIQQLENNLIVPKIMQKVSGFSPLVILLAFLIGSNFFGVIGAILAVPVTMISAIILKRILLDRN